MPRLIEMPCFQIVLDEGETAISTHTIPKDALIPKKVYMNYSTALDALKQYTAKLESFIPVAYGQAFPYDTVTFEQLIYQKGFAIYGWMLVRMQDDEETQMRVGVGLQLLQLVTPQDPAS
jgi:hypothetical protein